MQKLLKQKPAPLTAKKNLALITPGNFEDDFDKLKDVDWIIEVIVENLDIKKGLFEKIDAVRKPGTILARIRRGIALMQWQKDVQKISKSTSLEHTSLIHHVI